MKAQVDLDVLVVGYSCFDRAVLRLIEQSGRAVSSAVFVCGSENAGRSALVNLQTAAPTMAPREDRDSVYLFHGDLAAFVSSDRFEMNVEGPK